jgi:CRP/FNR family transcriptional regulator
MQDSIIDYIKRFPVREIKKDTLLFPVGAVAENCYAIRSGFVKVSSLDSDGREQLHWIAGRYDVVPTEAFFRRNHDLEYFYTALSDISVYQIGKAELLSLATKDPAVSLEIARGMSDHYDDLMFRVKSEGRANLREKIMFTLLFICQRFGDGGDTAELHSLGLPLTQQDIANMVGATRESTTIELNHLRDAGYINYSRSSFEISSEKLKATLNE